MQWNREIPQFPKHLVIIEDKIIRNIIITAFDITHSAEIEDTATAIEFIDKCALLAESVGYSPSLVSEALLSVEELRK